MTIEQKRVLTVLNARNVGAIFVEPLGRWVWLANVRDNAATAATTASWFDILDVIGAQARSVGAGIMTRRNYAIMSLCVRVFGGIKDLRERYPDAKIAHVEIRKAAVESMSSSDYMYHDIADRAERSLLCVEAFSW